MLKVAWSPVYRYRLPPGHRFPMEKYELLPEQLLYEGTLQPDHFFEPQALEASVILKTHTHAYWQSLQDQTLSAKAIRKIGFPMSPELVQRGRHIAQGTLDAARFARRFGIAMNSAGGTHHAFADRGEGFCVFNDIALAINELLSTNEAQKVLIIDLDVHQGNGNAAIFQDEPRVCTFSMHGEKNYPLRKETSDLDIGLPDGIEDAAYLQLLDRNLKTLIEQIMPDIAFFQAGVDVLRVDRLGRLALTLSGCRRRDEMVMHTCKSYGIPLVVTMGGGYPDRLKDLIEAHANTYRAVMEIYF
jgi:acetoin utilization deacetylase AcuC-like enzyme